jgi:sigma-54 dependent transcriptional regulator, flagellar regulatory protein
MIAIGDAATLGGGADGLIVGESPAMAEVRRLVRQVGPSPASVLITGPSGSGKEVVARAIHAESVRAAKAYVPVNCGAIPRDLLESELFGHEKGAFTGAHAQHRGRFEEAHGGTLFLDEIGDMPADMQVKLLRVLEERAVSRVGGRGQIAIDARIVSATHRDIDAAIDDGRFREDLFYRLAVFPICLPALAERREDLPLLVRHFLKRQPGQAPRFNAAAMDRLAAHGWPGNVRELRNLVERAAIIYPGQTLGAEQVDAIMLRRGRVGAAERAALWDATDRIAAAAPAAAPAPVAAAPEAPAPAAPEPRRADLSKDSPLDLKSVIAGIEQDYIAQALDLTGGVVAEAARLLSLQRTTLIEKMRKYDLARAA